MNKIKNFFKNIDRLKWKSIIVCTILVNIIFLIDNKNPLGDYIKYNIMWFCFVLLLYLKILLENNIILKNTVKEEKEIVDDKQEIVQDVQFNYKNYIDSINRQLEYYKKMSSKIPELEEISKMTFEEYNIKYKK